MHCAFIQLVVYSMQNPVVYRLQKSSVLLTIYVAMQALRSFLTFALRILFAHNLWRHLAALMHVHTENIANLP